MGAQFHPSSSQVIEGMLKMAGVNSDSIVYDLGCGDGRILLSAAKDFHAKKVVGIEQNSRLCRIALKKTAGLSGVQVLCANYDDVNLSEANVITLYQSASENARLKRKFNDELSKNTVIVTHDFGIPGWRPRELRAFREGRHGYRVIVYLMGFHTPSLSG